MQSAVLSAFVDPPSSEIILTVRRFYYSDERQSDGAPAYFNIDGEAHGKFYLQLAESKSQGPWQQTFVKGIGYKKF